LFGFVYLILSAQYESFILPLPVILSLPTGIFGAFLCLSLLGLENNIYAQVAMVMLIGLLGKNAVLIVEFAVQKKRKKDFPQRSCFTRSIFEIPSDFDDIICIHRRIDSIGLATDREQLETERSEQLLQEECSSELFSD
jgi:hypothetical protein